MGEAAVHVLVTQIMETKDLRALLGHSKLFRTQQ